MLLLCVQLTCLKHIMYAWNQHQKGQQTAEKVVTFVSFTIQRVASFVSYSGCCLQFFSFIYLLLQYNCLNCVSFCRIAVTVIQNEVSQKEKNKYHILTCDSSSVYSCRLFLISSASLGWQRFVQSKLWFYEQSCVDVRVGPYRRLSTDAFQLQCQRRLLKAPWTSRRSNQSI